jgi:hypothetical protein
MFNSRTSEIKELCEFFDIKIFCLAMIIMAEIHKDRMIKGVDKESVNKDRLIKE